MKKLFAIFCLGFLAINSYGQNTFDLSILPGTWVLSNGADSVYMEMKLKQGSFQYDNTTIISYVGGYKLVTPKYNIDKLHCYNLNIENRSYPVRIFYYFGVIIRFHDFIKANPKGEEKLVYNPRRTDALELLSTNPYKIKILLQPDQHEYYAFSPDEVFPTGTSLPTEMIFTKVAD